MIYGTFVDSAGGRIAGKHRLRKGVIEELDRAYLLHLNDTSMRHKFAGSFDLFAILPLFILFRYFFYFW